MSNYIYRSKVFLILILSSQLCIAADLIDFEAKKKARGTKAPPMPAGWSATDPEAQLLSGPFWDLLKELRANVGDIKACDNSLTLGKEVWEFPKDDFYNRQWQDDKIQKALAPWAQSLTKDQKNFLVELEMVYQLGPYNENVQRAVKQLHDSLNSEQQKFLLVLLKLLYQTT